MLRLFINILRDSIRKFGQDRLNVHAAALAFYGVFSLPPLLVVLTYSTARIYNQKMVEQWIFDRLGTILGTEGPKLIASTIQKLLEFDPHWLTASISIATILYMATSAFANMKSTLNHIFQTQTQGRSHFLRQITDRIISFGLLLTLGAILIASLITNSIVKQIDNFFNDWLGIVINTGISKLLPLLAIVILFTLIYKILPDIKLRWYNTLLGGFITALLFSLGNVAISYLIRYSKLSNFYDAAGSLMILMIWIYYASIVFYLGACITFQIIQRQKQTAKKVITRRILKDNHLT